MSLAASLSILKLGSKTTLSEDCGGAAVLVLDPAEAEATLTTAFLLDPAEAREPLGFAAGTATLRLVVGLVTRVLLAAAPSPLASVALDLSDERAPLATRRSMVVFVLLCACVIGRFRVVGAREKARDGCLGARRAARALLSPGRARKGRARQASKDTENNDHRSTTDRCALSRTLR